MLELPSEVTIQAYEEQPRVWIRNERKLPFLGLTSVKVRFLQINRNHLYDHIAKAFSPASQSVVEEELYLTTGKSVSTALVSY